MTRPTILPAPRDRRPTLAVWKFASCDGCQLTLLDCEDELLAIAERLTIASFAEATTTVIDGPYDLSLVEGSVSTPEDAERIVEIREQSRVLVTIGACATAGGIQALRNTRSIADVTAAVYPRPEDVSTLAESTPISDHVPVDLELRGCPIDKGQLLEVVAAFVAHRPPHLPSTSVCTECKARGIPCLMVGAAVPCLGPVTHAGCGALCPAFDRGCFGCFGPAETANTDSLDEWFRQIGVDAAGRERLWRGFTAWAPEFHDAAERAAAKMGSDAPVEVRR